MAICVSLLSLPHWAAGLSPLTFLGVGWDGVLCKINVFVPAGRSNMTSNVIAGSVFQNWSEVIP